MSLCKRTYYAYISCRQLQRISILGLQSDIFCKTQGFVSERLLGTMQAGALHIVSTSKPDSNHNNMH